MEKKSVKKVTAPVVEGAHEAMELAESAVISIANWEFAWLFDLVDFGEEDDIEANAKPVVSW